MSKEQMMELIFVNFMRSRKLAEAYGKLKEKFEGRVRNISECEARISELKRANNSKEELKRKYRELKQLLDDDFEVNVEIGREEQERILTPTADEAALCEALYQHYCELNLLQQLLDAPAPVGLPPAPQPLQVFPGQNLSPAQQVLPFLPRQPRQESKDSKESPKQQPQGTEFKEPPEVSESINVKVKKEPKENGKAATTTINGQKPDEEEAAACTRQQATCA